MRTDDCEQVMYPRTTLWLAGGLRTVIDNNIFITHNRNRRTDVFFNTKQTTKGAPGDYPET